jgi:hypothetical protein
MGATPGVRGANDDVDPEDALLEVAGARSEEESAAGTRWRQAARVNPPATSMSRAVARGMGKTFPDSGDQGDTYFERDRNSMTSA